MDLYDKIQFVKGVGPKKAKLLKEELEIVTIADLLEFFPYRFDDRTNIYKISDITQSLTSTNIQITGYFTGEFEIIQKEKKRLVANFTDNTGTVKIIWFKGFEWIRKKYLPNIKYLIFGKPNLYKNEISFIHPEIEIYSTSLVQTNKLLPVYPSKEKLKKNFINNNTFRKMISAILPEVYSKIPETLPDYIIEKYKLMKRRDAIKNMHLPQNPNLVDKARYRLKFEELLFVQLKIQQRKFLRKTKSKGFVFEKVGDLLNKFYKNNLPFELTNAQKRAIKQIRKDFKTGNQMNRLLQGDVGSGKTLVALMSMLIAIDNGYQTALMVPTEVLAQQHFYSIKQLLAGLPVSVELLTGSLTPKTKKEIKKRIASGKINIIIGTHALIEDDVVFRNLGFVVIDEQHRFGVAQRAKMWEKNTTPPHILVMTATPIPRTLAMTLYGDLDVSVIDEMPPGRKPINTFHIKASERYKVYNFIKKQIDKGRQAYVVFPIIEHSPKLNYENLVAGYNDILSFFPPPKYLIAMVHGKMKPAEKEEEMRLFVSGQAQIMVATTVIEVGINVANATIMVIESAEKFGLSQLHQLRGRVGRGIHQSYCFLITKNKIGETAQQRMNIMVSTNNGFEIAEADLKLRGPGDIEGKQQSGMPINLKIAELGKDGKLLEFTKNVAIEILNEDVNLEKPENKILKQQLKKIYFKEVDWSKIS